MVLVGLTVLFATAAVYIAIRPQPWLLRLFKTIGNWSQYLLLSRSGGSDWQDKLHDEQNNNLSSGQALDLQPSLASKQYGSALCADRLAMPPPSLPAPIIHSRGYSSDSGVDGPQTPRVKSTSLTSTPSNHNLAPPMMRSSYPALNSPQRARPTPAPNRNIPHGTTSGLLAPPPSHSSPPAKPNRAVALAPGHSPLDWARIAEDPTADLRGLSAGAPQSLLRVPPSLLRRMTGRKGKDAWMAIDGRVYNVSPYANFHPGGIPEMMRGAARDATALFGEVHPWVNYESMLRACLVGILVGESDGPSNMDEMD